MMIHRAQDSTGYMSLFDCVIVHTITGGAMNNFVEMPLHSLDRAPRILHGPVGSSRQNLAEVGRSRILHYHLHHDWRPMVSDAFAP